MDAVNEKLYSVVFKDFPDVMNIQQVSKLLNISTKTVYKLIKDEKLLCLKVGREFRIPKINIIKYLEI